MAVGHVKTLFRGREGPVDPKAIIRLAAGEDVPAPPLPEEVRQAFGLTDDSDGRPGVVNARSREPIAIVGVGCRLPGGIDDTDQFWSALLDGTDCVVDIPDSRWDPQRFFDPTGRAPGRSYVQKAGMLTEDPTTFDAAFFGIPPREAATMDPQQRLLLECAWESFEDAGESPNWHAGRRTAVFVGGFMMDNQLVHGDPLNIDRLTTHSATASTVTMLSSRLSYLFDLRGPCVAVDTACSSSLVAVHLACQSIWSGESAAALAGGVNVLLSPVTQVTMAKGRFLSKTGKCQAFDENADGYVRGEGAVVMLLKPLSAARRDGNNVHAVILGTASNQDGRTNGITVPNGEAQIAVMREAYAQAGIAPGEVSYVEAHGTGTPVGDPIEAQAIGRVVGAERTGGPCLIGSVKTNLGHLEAAAGAVGVLKAAMVVKNSTVPPHLHLGRVNPAIDTGRLNLEIPTRATPLPRLGARLVAGVNSFGYGGSNAHVVLAEPPQDVRHTHVSSGDPVGDRPEPLLVFSARSPEALRELAHRHAELISASDADIATYCRSAAVHRSHHRYRAALPAAERPTLVESLRAFGSMEQAAASSLETPKVLFVYTGMGPQWWAMGRQLYRSNRTFQSAVEECDSAFREISGRSILADMLADESVSRMAHTDVAQPANAVLQIALTRLWQSWGLLPDGVLGHSVGEVAAAYAARSLTLEQALRVAHHRSRLQARLAGRGAMLAVGVSAAEAGQIADGSDGTVSVAAVNGTTSVTLAGDPDALDAIAARLTEAGRFNRILQVEVPYHSPVMDEMGPRLLASLADLEPAPAAVDVYSTATGALLRDELHDAAYWWRNVRGCVRFADALTAAVADGYRIFVEIGPHPVLAASIADTLGDLGVQGATVTSLRRGAHEPESMSAALRSVYLAGARIDWATYFGPGSFTPVPKYPWQRERFWEESTESRRRRLGHERHPMVFGVQHGSPKRLDAEASFAALPYLEDHHVAGAVLFPGAGHIELALEARRLLTGSPACSIEELEFTAAVPLQADVNTELYAFAATDSPEFTVQSMAEDADALVCARAKLYSVGRRAEPVDLASLIARCDAEVGVEVLYDSLAERGLRYGPQFRGVASLHRGTNEVVAGLALPEGVDGAGYHLHPVLLDAAFHSLLAAADGGGLHQDLIPVGVERIQFFGPSAPVAFSHGTITRSDPHGVLGDLELIAADGTVIAAITGFRCRVMPAAQRGTHLDRCVYQRNWVPSTEVYASVGARLLLDADNAEAVVGELAAASESVAVVDVRWATEPAESARPVEAGADAAELLLTTVRSLPTGANLRYYLVTCRAEWVEGDSHPPAVQLAPLLGVARTIMSERPDLAVTLVDFDTPPVDADALFDVLGRVGGEQEIAVRDGELLCARLDRALSLAPQRDEPMTVPVGPEMSYEVTVGEIGALASIGFVECDRPAVADTEVEVEVEFAPLNFKDILKALGLISLQTSQGTYTEDKIGMEVSGRISRVGRLVTNVEVGDRVYAFFPNALRSHLVVPNHRLAKLPASVSLEQSSGLFASITAYYSLVTIGQLQRGETVLIHGATGGVGMAAIDVANWVGAEVIATAGSEEKREHLRSLGISRVTESRNVSFYDDVMSWTNGRGVDVVLNYSPGELMRKGVACLAPFGRFIEIGKLSFDRDEALGLRPFNENLVYASIDMDRLTVSRPETIAGLYAEVLALIDRGELRKIPVTVFPASRIGDAFRLMGRSRHIGKVAVAVRDPELQLQVKPEPPVCPGATYLVTGGLGGFGLETAKEIARMGARHLALLSRSGAVTELARTAVRDLAASGVDVRVFAVDVGRRDDLAAVLDDIASTMPPLRGVVHSAAVLDDRPVARMDRESLDRVLSPKASGAWNLHSLTRDLDFFVMYSSISSFIGNAGQANYVAANALLDSLAAYRRFHGQAASVIQWGVLGDTGLVARDANVAAHLESLGLTPLSTAEALAALQAVIHNRVDRVAVVDADWSRLSSAVAPMAGDRRLSLLADSGGADTAAAALISYLQGLAEDARRNHVLEALGEIVAGVLQMEEFTFPYSQPLHEIGMDSIMGLEIATGIEKVLGLRVSAVELSSGPSIEQLGNNLLGRLGT